ncbi:DUF885 domain-containing protein [Sphingomonas donggukensis]|uniref:DUF885 domain-containing protein n=1 Tax=Sphingomonas donggukensis TaxID=2949093 RepID=A0ABY4U0D6_9SPHN|nr:DUF885 domain-containing protein [Sphingomonas donggukensis]URW76834.1 DUF885 domain-containing protein [Sphingomonas donggukensis]
MRWKYLATAVAAGMMLASCSGGGGSGGTTAASTVNGQDWPTFVKATIERNFQVDPSFAVYQGRHDFDGRLPDWSEAGLKAQADFYRGAIDTAGKFGGLTPEQLFERDYLTQVMKGRLFWLVDADQPHRNPAFYVGGGLDPNVYISREYADAPTRMKAVIAFLKNVPTAAANIRANLKMPMPASFIYYGSKGFGGFADYYGGDAKAAFAGVQDAALQQEFATAAAAASKSMRDLATWMDQNAKSATQDYALGADKFAKMVADTEGVNVSLDELERVGRADLKRNQDMLVAECAKFAPGASVPDCMVKLNANKGAGGPVATATRQIPELKAFVVAKNLITIPDAEQALVRESPPYNRQNSAYIDPPGPFEKGIPSIYYISPPDPTWTPAVQAAFVPGEADLLFTTVHEVMPGHFLQFRHANRVKSLFGRLYVGYAFAEGWAHYAEEMMWEAGLRGTPETHIGQLSNALLRDCRYLSAIGLHARGMSQADSQKMFQEQCFQDEGTAKQQAARGTYDPAYLNYTMGKLMIRKLRADWTAKNGGREAWKDFHDMFLSYGGPPIPLVRGAMMGTKTEAVF